MSKPTRTHWIIGIGLSYVLSCLLLLGVLSIVMWREQKQIPESAARPEFQTSVPVVATVTVTDGLPTELWIVGDTYNQTPDLALSAVQAVEFLYPAPAETTIISLFITQGRSGQLNYLLGYSPSGTEADTHMYLVRVSDMTSEMPFQFVGEFVGTLYYYSSEAGCWETAVYFHAPTIRPSCSQPISRLRVDVSVYE